VPTNGWGERKGWIEGVPLFLWLGISGATIFLFEAGPYIYDVPNHGVLILYLVLAHAAVILGYRSGWHSPRPAQRAHLSNERIVRVIAILGAVACLSILIALAGDASKGLNMNLAFEDPLAARDVWMSDENLGIRYIAVLLDAATLPFVGLTIFNWRLCPTKLRLFFGSVVLLNLCDAVIGASRASIFSLGCVSLIAIVGGMASGGLKVKVIRMSLIFATALASFVVYSSFIAQSRQGNVIADYSEFVSAHFETRPAVVDMIGRLPLTSQAAILQGSYYFSHSYKYLGRCLAMDFEGTTYGLGFSRFLTRSYTKLSGDGELEKRVYFQRLIEEGESPSLWMSGYGWIASDWTFTGSVIPLFILGRWMALSWRDSLAGSSVTGPCVLCWLFFIAAMLPIDCALSGYGALISVASSLWAWNQSRSRIAIRQT
jgi:hypothetical protein